MRYEHTPFRVRLAAQHSAHLHVRSCSLNVHKGRATHGLEAVGVLVVQNDEMEKVRERVNEWPMQRLEEEGYVATDLNLQPEGFLYKCAALTP